MGRLVGPSGGDPDGAISRGIDVLERRIPPGLLRAGLVLESTWKQLLLTPGRGRIYRRGKKGVHQASAPGDPPAPDYGTLERSITHDPVNDTTLRVGTNVEYAPLLEFGTLPRGSEVSARSGRGALGSRLGGIAPRPHARPALTRAEPAMTAALADELSRGNVRADLGSDVGGLNV